MVILTVCDVILHCTFDLHFSSNEWCWVFSCVYWPSVYFFWRNVYLAFLPIFWLGCFSDTELYELLIYFGDSSCISFFICNYFLPFWGLSFNHVYCFFCCAKALIKSHLFIFVYISITLGDGSKQSCCDLCQGMYTRNFFSKSFIVSRLTFKSLIYFEFTFEYGV